MRARGAGTHAATRSLGSGAARVLSRISVSSGRALLAGAIELGVALSLHESKFSYRTGASPGCAVCIRGSIAVKQGYRTKMTRIIGEFTEGTRRLHDSWNFFKGIRPACKIYEPGKVAKTSMKFEILGAPDCQ